MAGPTPSFERLVEVGGGVDVEAQPRAGRQQLGDSGMSGGRAGAECRLECDARARPSAGSCPVPAASATKPRGCASGERQGGVELVAAQGGQIADERGDRVAGPALGGGRGALAQRPR